MVVNNRDEARIAADTWPAPVPEITPDMALQQGMHHISLSAAISSEHMPFWRVVGYAPGQDDL